MMMSYIDLGWLRLLWEQVKCFARGHVWELHFVAGENSTESYDKCKMCGQVRD